MNNNVYIVTKEFFSSYDDDGSTTILGVYQSEEDAKYAINIHKEYLKINFPDIQHSYSYEIEETILNNFNPNIM